MAKKLLEYSMTFEEALATMSDEGQKKVMEQINLIKESFNNKKFLGAKKFFIESVEGLNSEIEMPLEEKEIFLNVLMESYAQCCKLAREKYTPKKYRKAVN